MCKAVMYRQKQIPSFKSPATVLMMDLYIVKQLQHLIFSYNLQCNIKVSSTFLT